MPVGNLDSNHFQALTAVATAIRKLGLPGIQGDEIVVRNYPWRGSGQEITYHRGISVHPGGEQESRGTNERDDIGYGVFITMLKPADHDTAEGIALIPFWRRKIREALHHTRLKLVENGSNEIETVVQPGNYLTPRGVRGRYNTSVLLVRCWMRERTKRSSEQ